MATCNFTNAKPENACKLLACIASVLYLKPKKSCFIMRLDTMHWLVNFMLRKTRCNTYS